MSGRYNPDNSPLFEQRRYSGEGFYDGDVVKYVKRAMCAVDQDYTRRTKEAGEAAKQHLRERISNVSFEYQGSVMTDTHIRGASDIDLIVVCDKFQGTEITKVREELQSGRPLGYVERARLAQYNSSFSQYLGNSTEDLRCLRASIERVMSANYTICDISKPKAVKITNQHLHRDVDIVTASWYQSYDYVISGMPDEMRGIKIFNKETGNTEGPDYPFLSISRINERSAQTNGRLKRMIRFLKNVKTDSNQEINLSSFDINAICYSIPTYTYQNADYKELVSVIWSHMYRLWHDNKQDDLRSVVGDEYVFLGKPDKVHALKLLESEVFSIKCDLDKA